MDVTDKLRLVIEYPTEISVVRRASLRKLTLRYATVSEAFNAT